MDYKEIDKRYSGLAESGCCLSCGGAVSYSEVAVGEVCVDLGSGRGTDALRMAEMAGNCGFVFGVDISEGMIHKAMRTAEQLEITNVRFIHSPLEKLDLPDGIADLVTSNCTINHSSDKPAVWREIHRVLKDGGRFVVSDIYSTDTVPEMYRNDPAAVAECWAGSVTRNEYLSHLSDAGFAEIRILEESAPYEKGSIMVSSWTIAGHKLSEKQNRNN